MYCKYCGKELAEGWKFCSYCGTNQDVSPAPPSPVPAPVCVPQNNLPAANPRNDSGLVICSVISMIIEFAVIVLSFFDFCTIYNTIGIGVFDLFNVADLISIFSGLVDEAEDAAEGLRVLGGIMLIFIVFNIIYFIYNIYSFTKNGYIRTKAFGRKPNYEYAYLIGFNLCLILLTGVTILGLSFTFSVAPSIQMIFIYVLTASQFVLNRIYQSIAVQKGVL